MGFNVGGLLKSVGKKIVSNVIPGGDLILSGIGMVQGARQQGKADKLNKEALNIARQRDAELAPLRQAGLSRLTNTQRPDLSSIYAGSSNPFARPLRPLSPSMGAETPRGPMADDPMERPLREITEPPMPRMGGLRRMR